jgi:uncharacterized Ntn-hydrolase superfamily protein
VTYSIVAFDPETSELGVGVQTHQPAVGAVVPWVTPGVGAVATQAFARASIGPQALALLESGLDATQALAAVTAADNAPVLRQVAIVDARGESAAHTGAFCVPHAGHETGSNFSVQANMMRRPTVPATMARTFEFARGPLAMRILAALEAAEADGGDLRGAQSAALLVRGPAGVDENSLWDLRVDNDPRPLVRLRELAHMRLAGQVLRKAESARPSDRQNAMRHAFLAYNEANRLAPSDEQTFWFAVTTLFGELGDPDRAADVLTPLFRRAPQWRELLHRLPMLKSSMLLERFPREP